MSSASRTFPVLTTVTRPRSCPLSATSPVTKMTPLKFGLAPSGIRYALSPERTPERSGHGPDLRRRHQPSPTPGASVTVRSGVSVSPVRCGNRWGSPPRKQRRVELDSSARTESASPKSAQSCAAVWKLTSPAMSRTAPQFGERMLGSCTLSVLAGVTSHRRPVAYASVESVAIAHVV